MSKIEFLPSLTVSFGFSEFNKSESVAGDNEVCSSIHIAGWKYKTIIFLRISRVEYIAS